MSALDPALWLDLVGKPVVFHGRGPDTYDCYGLVLEIYKRRGIVMPDLVYPNSEAAHATLFANGIATWGWKPCEMRPGATLAFRRGNAVQHVGVAIDSDRFIHATEDFGQVVVSKLSSRFPIPFQNRLQGVYDYAV